jgi:hypothetical protein
MSTHANVAYAYLRYRMNDCVRECIAATVCVFLACPERALSGALDNLEQLHMPRSDHPFRLYVLKGLECPANSPSVGHPSQCRNMNSVATWRMRKVEISEVARSTNLAHRLGKEYYHDAQASYKLCQTDDMVYICREQLSLRLAVKIAA